MFVPANVWFCCLYPTDKAAVQFTAALFVPLLNQPIERSLFEAAWTLSPLYYAAGIDAVLYYYGLEHTFIIIPDEPPIPAIGIVNLPLWLDIEAFLLVGGAACGDGCDVPSFLIP